MASRDSFVATELKQFRFDFLPPHTAPQLTGGKWYIEGDGCEEFEIVNEEGRPIALLWDRTPDGEMETNAQCIALVPELVRGIYTAMRALRGAVPDNETPETVAQYLSELLKRTYSLPMEGDTIKG